MLTKVKKFSQDNKNNKVFIAGVIIIASITLSIITYFMLNHSKKDDEFYQQVNNVSLYFDKQNHYYTPHQSSLSQIKNDAYFNAIISYDFSIGGRQAQAVPTDETPK